MSHYDRFPLDDPAISRVLSEVPKSNLGDLAGLLRKLGEHAQEDHRCPDMRRILDQVAARLEFFHNGALALARQHGGKPH